MLHSAVIRPLAIGVVLVALFAFFFVYPGHDPKPHELPIAMVEVDAEVRSTFERAGFDVIEVDELRAGRELVLDRDAYAVLSTPDRRVLVASAASAPIAEIVRGLVPAEGWKVEDVRAVDEDDPRGLGINLAVLATTVPAILGAMLIVTLAPMVAGARRLLALAIFALLGGLAAMLVVSVGIGAIPGNLLALWAITAFAVFAIGVTAAALIQLLGPAGVGVSFLLLLMLGNPASGAAGGRHLLPEPWSTGGQFLPPGAFATGLRNIAYFDGAQAALWGGVLVAWAAIGTAVVLRGGAGAPGQPAGSERPAAA